MNCTCQVFIELYIYKYIVLIAMRCTCQVFVVLSCTRHVCRVYNHKSYMYSVLSNVQCPECTRNDTSLTSNDIILISRVSSAFYQRVLGLTVIEGYTSKEITSFNMVVNYTIRFFNIISLFLCLCK